MSGSELEVNPLLHGRISSSLGSRLCRSIPSIHRNMVLVVTCAAISGFCFGYEVGIIDTILAMPSFQGWSKTFPDDPNAPETTGWIVSTFLFGCIAGSIAVSWLADYIGRKRSILVGALLFCLGGAGQSAASSLAVLYSMRVLSGSSIGILSMVAPLYISETSPAEVRGSLIAVQQLLITFGVLVASCVNAGIYSLGGSSGNLQWRAALAVQVVPGVLLFCLILAMPFSPRWLLMRGRAEEAAAVIVHLRGAAGPQDAAVQAELSDMRAGLAEDRRVSARSGGDPGGSWRDLWHPSVRWPLMLACVLQIAQQWTGINVILYYAADLFTRMGIEKSHASTSLVIVNALLLFVGTVPGMFLVEHRHVGRKKLLIVGGIAMTVSHACVCAFIRASEAFSVGSSAAASFSWLGVVSMYAFTVSFAATWGPVVWVFQNEVLPLRVRARGTAVATLMNWIQNAIIGKVAPLMLRAIGSYTYAIFAALCLAMTLFSVFCVPETQGVSLEGMEALFGGGTADKAIAPAQSEGVPADLRPAADLSADAESLTFFPASASDRVAIYPVSKT